MKTQCLLCNLTNTRFLLKSFNIHGRYLLSEEDKFDILQCLDCGCMFIANIEVNDEYYKKYYDSGYYKNTYENKKLISCILNILSNYSFKKKQKLILKNVQNEKRKLKILDIGCGKGFFLNEIDSLKFEKYGVEISEEGYRSCKIKGLNVFNDRLENIDFKGIKFDVVTLCHVLEHIEKPIELFNKINQILRSDGILILSTPNIDCLGFRYGKENWFHLDSPRHLILYNQKSINWLLKETGFKITKVKNEFYDYPVDLFWSLRKSWVRFFIYPSYPLFKILDKECLTFICKRI